MTDLIERLREDADIMRAKTGFPTVAAELDEAAGEIARLNQVIEGIGELGLIAAEEVAQKFIERERANPFSPMYRLSPDVTEHNVRSMGIRLTEVIRRARVDGANAEPQTEERSDTAHLPAVTDA